MSEMERKAKISKLSDRLSTIKSKPNQTDKEVDMYY